MNTLRCRAVSVALRRLRHEGTELASLLDGLPTTRAAAEKGDLDWPTLCALLARIEIRVGGPAQLTELGARAAAHARSGAAARGLALITSSTALYRRLVAELGAHVRAELARGADGRLTVTVATRDDAMPCPQLFRLLAGLLRGLPVPLFRVEALVDSEPAAEPLARAARFVVTPPPSMTLWARLARAARVLVSARATLGELSAQHAQLERRMSELVEARDRAEAAARVKSQFLANMSHELRTPLNAILGTAGAMLEVPRRGSDRDDLLAMHSAAEQLLDLVTDTLAISGDHVGERTLRAQAFEPLALVRTVLAVSGAEERGLRVRAVAGPGVPACVRGDDGRLRRTLGKLVGNAVKFGREGGAIDIELARDPEIADGLCITVRDDGEGIPAEVLPHLFDPFVQLDSSSTRAHEGAGLGLSVARELVERMGGTIAVTSVVGEGSCFTLRLVFPAARPSEVRVSLPERMSPLPRHHELRARIPLKVSLPVAEPAAVAATPPATRTEDLPGASAIRRRVLIVEDNVVNQRLIVRIVEKLGCDVRVVGDGQQALETLDREPFDAVLMDCQMPVMDGYDATRAIRAKEALKPDTHLPVIAVTAHATAGDRERCLEAGMDDYLTKPVRADVLASTLTTWLTKGTRTDN